MVSSGQSRLHSHTNKSRSDRYASSKIVEDVESSSSGTDSDDE